MDIQSKNGLVSRLYKKIFEIAQKWGAVMSINTDEQLIEASEAGDLAKVKYLIATGMDPDTKGKWDDTPLIWAALKGHLKICEFLVTKGANPYTKNQCGSTPLSLAEENGHTEVIEFLKNLDLYSVNSSQPQSEISPTREEHFENTDRHKKQVLHTMA